MLLTLELMFSHEPKRSLLTVGELNIGYGPELIEAIDAYVGKNAETPPGVWMRKYKGLHYLTQSVPALPFFTFLRSWGSVPIVGEFLEMNYRFVLPSHDMMPGACFNVWVNRLDEPEAVAVAMQLTA
ncbi:hypothetical protein [Serratia entomophila]|uniref:hypothetical protein n=1 Tax=Serratia entomophila TaxID=42906 RepID=UPI00217A455F|nr:hypothetical protein [Serratia entomophila]CAI0786521.1 Uncharacterised protein [Serratia entomophila]CAI1498824.1 Uncharacterised protein [Serratia entomophila]CAI1505217.1 Uncharacterised protein [Serratia entomophila]CAI1514742.1 Uncharacterised protein [Serratia entomophila]CAI1600271.1 Uncharacterised protein [Serratia entomophila]